MSKKSQTTGQPKPKQRKSVSSASEGKQAEAKGIRKSAPTPTREFRSRAEREAQIQRYVVLGTSIVTVVLVVALAIAFLVDQVIIPNQAVAVVNGNAITVAQFRERVRLEQVLITQEVNNQVAFLQQLGFPSDQINQFLFSQPPYSTYIQELQDPTLLGNRVLNDMVDDQLVRDTAAAQGIFVADAEVDAYRAKYFNYDPATAGQPPTPTPTPTTSPTPFVPPTLTPTPLFTPTPTLMPTPEGTVEATAEATGEATVDPLSIVPTIGPTPTLSATDIAERYNTNLDNFYSALRAQASVSDETIDRYFEILALREKVQGIVVPVAPTTLYANVRHILVNTEEEANNVLAALQAGESFAGMAIATSLDSGTPGQDGGSAARGGDLGWSPVGEFTTQYDRAFAEAIRSAQVGQLVGPVQSQFGFHIIQVRAFEERDLSESELESARQRALDNWLQTEREGKFTIYDNWSSFLPQ